MAVLKEQKAPSRILTEAMPPKGTHVAICIDVEDAFGVQRPKFDDPTQLEIVDLTTFYFGFKAKGGELHVIRSKPFKLSLHEKSALFGFLKAWNLDSPKAGFDTVTMRGKSAQITVDHNVSAKGRVFANIQAIAPVMDGLEGLIPKAPEFANLLAPQRPVGEGPDADALPF